VLAIDGNANSRIFSIYATDPACPGLDGPDYLVAISGLRLTNARRNVAGSNGGAIFTEHSLSLDGVLIDNNIARGGAGVAMYVQYPGQVLTITDSQFNSNTATELLTATDTFPVAGGALYVVQRCANAEDVPYTQPVTVTIASSEFRGNLVAPLTTHDGRGGAIRSYSLADITIIDTIVSNNSVVAPTPLVAGYVHRGGGLEITAKSLFVDGSEISDNSVLESLGGDSTRGGGLMLANSSYDRQGPSGAMGARIVNSTISGNAATASVGAILVVGNVALELDNATVAGNVAAATRTGGIALAFVPTYPPTGSNTARPTLRLVSSIVADNAGTGGDIAATVSQFGALTVNATNSLIESICPPPNCTISVFGTGNLLGVDPLLAPLGDNGGLSRTHALLPGSPAINKGSNPLGFANDQRGDGFARTVGAGTDMGAFESASP